MKSKNIRIICENEGRAVYVEMGTPLLDILKQIYGEGPSPYLAAYVNNKIKELSYIVYEPVSGLFIDITHFEGHRVYERTLFFTLNKAIHDLWPERKFYVRHSVSRGFYSEISDCDEITPEMIAQIKGRMAELIAEALPIERTRVLYTEAEENYARLNMDDKIALLKTRPRLYVSLYALGDIVGYFYGALAPSTASIALYDLRPYYKGMYIAVPKATDPTSLNKMVPQHKMFDIFQEYKRWNDVVGVANIGQLNTKILAGEASDLIKMGEGFHEKKLASIADTILDAHRERGAKLVLMAGPSSSGKTTTAKRIAIQLRILGLTPVLISLDDYFVERD
ncbi:MAG: nucleoside kinase, partial [Rikenellaceae bacterium]|nr:nucleoside kinase [Rikenellaceae bacterium]